MNKKILVLTLVLIAVPLLGIFPVQAAPKNGLCFKLEMVGGIATAEGVGYSWTTPPGSTAYVDAKTKHLRGGDWVPDISISIQIGEPGDLEYEIITFDAEDYWSSISTNVNFNTMAVSIRVVETITFEDGSTIVLKVNERIDLLTGSSEGTMVGHGTDALEDVKIKGISYGVVDPPNRLLTREGTITGWE